MTPRSKSPTRRKGRYPAAVVASGVIFCAAGGGWGQYGLSVSGKVVMEDGSVPPRVVSIVQSCTGEAALEVARTNERGEYEWLAWPPEHGGSCDWRAVMGDVASNPALDLESAMPPFVLRRVANESAPRDSRRDWDRAVQAMQAGRWQEADRILSSMLEQDPHSATVWAALGISMATQGKKAEARAAFENAIKDNPRYVRGYHLLSTVEMDLGDWLAAAQTATAGTSANRESTYPELCRDIATIRPHLGKDGAEGAARKKMESIERTNCPKPR